MTKVFLGGSRNVSRLNTSVQERLRNIIDKGLTVIVGDANGADKAMQIFLKDHEYQNVEVFCVGDFCRNNIGDWKTNMVTSTSRERNFTFYAAKDQIMASEADFGFMLWDGKSVGTLLNIWRLLESQKKVVVYVTPEKDFWELKTLEQWSKFISMCDPSLRKKVSQKALDEQRDRVGRAQSILSL